MTWQLSESSRAQGALDCTGYTLHIAAVAAERSAPLIALALLSAQA